MSETLKGAQAERWVEALLSALGSGDQARVELALDKLGVKRSGVMYARVGEMARALHESLKDFQRSLDPHGVTMHNTTVPDASSKLQAVIEMTFEAANRTLSSIDAQEALLDESQARMTALEAALVDPAVDLETLKGLTRAHLDAQRRSVDRMRDLITRILMAQAFQDLTGQSIKKVIKLVEEIEGGMVQMVQIFGLSEAEAEAPAAAEEEGMLEQGDVESILSSFGF
ncbi:protein phosphatase CheZ [Myxococcota bacterium]|nr:protein phosphatase CheZ [Myxococcota bacterium]MBU1900183.1 protein phosphatase CheZ [Myxococcota bacterium]